MKHLKNILVNVPSILEDITKDDNVLIEKEIKFILKNHLFINERDHDMIISILKKFKIIRKVSSCQNNNYYIIGRKTDEKIEEFNLEKKKLNVMLKSMNKQDENLTKEVAHLKKDIEQAKILKSPKVKVMLISFSAKVKTLKALRGRIMLMTQKIGQFKNAQTDIEMGNLLKDNNKILEEGGKDSLDIIKNTIDIGTKMQDMQNFLKDIVTNNTQMDDIDKMFNELNDEISIPVEISNKINEDLTNSGILSKTGTFTITPK